MESGPFIGHDRYLYETRGSAIEAKFTKRRQFPGRNSTGQLRRALMVSEISSMGCLLFVRPCYAATGKKVDYVTVLMKGAKERDGHPYIPALDRRVKVKGKKWGGIAQTYWLRWQHYFMKKVEMANARLHTRITQMLTQMKVLQQQDLNRVYKRREGGRNITAIEAERETRKVRYGPVTPDSPYNKTRNSLGEGSYKRDPQTYYNKDEIRFNPYMPPRGPRKKGRF